MTEYGYVGVGEIKERAKMIRDVYIGKRRLLDLNLNCKKMGEYSNNQKLSEYVALVKWFKTCSRDGAIWRSKPKLYTTTHVRASLDGQPDTVKFLEEAFQIDIRKRLRRML